MNHPTPTNLASPKLYHKKSGHTVMFESIDDGKHINIWTKVSPTVTWELTATLKTEYARHTWNYHVEVGGERIQD